MEQQTDYNQMTIWDYLPETPLEDIPEEDAVKQIGDAIGVNFQPDKYGGYVAKSGKYILRCQYDRYCVDVDDEIGTGDLFIGVDFEVKNKVWGASAPRDSIQKAIAWFRNEITVQGAPTSARSM